MPVRVALRPRDAESRAPPRPREAAFDRHQVASPGRALRGVAAPAGRHAAREPRGTRLESPESSRNKPGVMRHVFGGDETMCEPQRNMICIGNITNMFDDHEVDPNAPIAP
jgi:hypothetical protein